MSEQPDHPEAINPGLRSACSGKLPARPGSADIADLFVDACRTFGHRPAYQIGGSWLNYSDCAARVSGIAASLHETLQGHVARTGTQAVIAVLLPNSHIVLECFFVAAISRSIVFPLNDRLSLAELERGIRASGATILLTSDAYAKTLLAMDWSSMGVATIVWAGAAVDVPVSNHLVWAPAQAQGPDARNPPWPRDLPAYLHGFNTSGTTGQIKTILHSIANVVEHTLASISALELNGDDEHGWAHIGPMFHVGDAVFVWIATLLGARHVFHDNQLQVTSVADLLVAERVTIVKLVPSMLQILCGSEALKGLRFPDLKWILTGGAAPDATLIRKTSELFGCDFIQGYGMTEATCHVAFKNESRSPSVEGLSVLPGLELKIIDENDGGLDAGAVGEIAIRGPTVFDRHVLEGKFETAVAGFTADGFYRSGDLGFLDTDDKLHIVGRKKDMINVGGENVFAWEIERIVGSLPTVKECAAFAVPHELLGEVAELAVVRSSADVTADAIRESCRRQLASFKVPQRVHFVDRLPRTPTGKVQKHLIREQIKPAPATPAPATVGRGAAEAVRQIVSRYMQPLTDSAIAPDQPLFDAGLDSLGALDLISQLEQHFGTTVSQTLLYDHPTINGLASYFEATGEAATRQPPAGAAAADENRASESTPGAIRRSATTPVSVLLQSAGIFLRPLVLALSILPVLILFDLCAQRLSRLELFLTGPGWLALLLADTMAIVVVVSRLLASPGMKQCELWTPRYFRWLFLHNLFRSLEIPLGVLRGSALLNVFYRLGGAKIGHGVELHSLALHDLHWLQIGDHTIISRDVNLQPAVITGGALVRRPIQIGSGCLIGPNATVLGGAQIPDDAMVPTLATISSSTREFGMSSPLKSSGKSRPNWPSCVRGLSGYLLVGYVVSAAISIGMLFVQHATKALGATVPSISAVLMGSPDPLASPAHGPLSLGFFAALALAIYLVVPVCYFLLVVVCKRTLIGRLSPQASRGKPGVHACWSHWLFNKLIDVPLFRMHLRLNVMSHIAKWNYQLLGSRIGARPFIAAPYTAEPELLELADGAMLAGNVSAYGLDACSGSIGKIRLGNSAIVANSCVLQAGANLAPATLLGDLSSAGQGDASPANTISVGSPPRVVGRTRLEADSVSHGRYILNQAMLGSLQWICLTTSNVAGFVAMGVCFNAALASFAPIWAVWITLLALPAVPRLVKTALVPLLKWMMLGKIAAGEFPAYGWTYCRWVLLETVIMDAESAFLTQLHGTAWLNLLWRSLGARVGSNACILASSLGCEFDLKEIGDEAVLQYQSLVFGHSIEHHALLFRPAKIGSRTEIGAGAIVEAGAVVDDASVVPASKPVHARQGRPSVGSANSSQPGVAQPAKPSQSPALQSEQDEATILVDHAELSAMTCAIFVASGSSRQEAHIVADHLVEANLRGHDSHGVGMIPMYLRNLAKGTLRPNCAGRVASDQGAMIVYDGERGYGQVTARAAIGLGIEQAQRAGLAVVALRNAHHIGRVGTYGEMCADAGLVSIHFVNITDQKPSVAPWLGGSARFGTNPVCVAVPAAEPGRPIILDMATSGIALGKVRIARNKGQQVDAGILLDGSGQPTTDPGTMFRQPRGALMTFGEHKGYALAFISEILGGALTGGGTIRPGNQAAATTTNGMLTILVDPARLVERGWLADEIRAMTDYVTSSPPMRSGGKVLVPGDPERQSRAQRIAAGIPIDDETWREIVEAANSLQVPIATPRAHLRRYSPRSAAGI